MFTHADLFDPGAVLVFRAHVAGRGACKPPLDWLAWVYAQGRTLADALSEAALTTEGRGWCAWCREEMADLMDDDVKIAFLRASLTEQRAFSLHFYPPPVLTDQERFLILISWHSAGGKVIRRRKAAERREAIG